MVQKFRNLRADEIEIRRGKDYKDGRVELLCYKTYSVDCTILDETVGPDNWVVNYKREGDTLLGGIAIWSDKHNAFLWKWAAGSPSEYETVKGEQADALKRAGFVWNIGRDNLYSAPKIVVTPESKYTTYYVEEVGYDDNGKMKDLVVKDSNGTVVFSYHNFKVDGGQPAQPKSSLPEEDKSLDWSARLRKWCGEMKDRTQDPEEHTKLLAFYYANLKLSQRGERYGVRALWRFFNSDIRDGKLEIDASNPRHPQVIKKGGE